MPQVLKKYQPKKRKGSTPKYDFKVLFSGKWIRLVRGVDFTCTVLSLTQMLRKHATKQKKRLRIHTEDQSTVVLKSLPLPKGKKQDG